MKLAELDRTTYSQFYQTYIDVLSDSDELMALLSKQRNNFPQFIKSIPENLLHYSYGPGKWTVAEVLVHIMDTERVFQYRALRIARNDKQSLSGFDQDLFVPFSGAENRSLDDLVEEYQIIRDSTLSLFRYMGPGSLERVGAVNENPMGVAALGFIICGHQRHHRNVLRMRYLTMD